MKANTAVLARSTVGNTDVIKVLDQTIGFHRSEATRLEKAKNLILASEPAVTSRRGRPKRQFQANAPTTNTEQAKRPARSSEG
jgi:hypothetical protein